MDLADDLIVNHGASLLWFQLLFLYNLDVKYHFWVIIITQFVWLNCASQWALKMKQFAVGSKQVKRYLLQIPLGNPFPLIKCSGTSICLARTLCTLCLTGYLPTSWESPGPIWVPKTAWCPHPPLCWASADLPGTLGAGISTNWAPFSEHGYFYCASAEVSIFRAGKENLPFHAIWSQWDLTVLSFRALRRDKSCFQISFWTTTTK